MNVTTIKETNKLDYSAREAFKFLRTNFLFCGNEYKTILITSCVKSEGKSTISIELAKSLAVADKKVLLIDADLRKSVFASQYTSNTQQIVGLSEFLSGHTEFENTLFSTQFENLSMIFAGAVPPNPVELLGSAKFDELIKLLNAYFSVQEYIATDDVPLNLPSKILSTFQFI